MIIAIIITIIIIITWYNKNWISKIIIQGLMTFLASSSVVVIISTESDVTELSPGVEVSEMTWGQ